MSNDKHQALREALEADPTPGVRRICGKKLSVLDDSGGVLFSRIPDGCSSLRSEREAQQWANVLLAAAAANPEAIHALLADHDRMRNALNECEKLLRRTPKINRDIYTGADKESWGVRAHAVLKTVRDTLKEGKQ